MGSGKACLGFPFLTLVNDGTHVLTQVAIDTGVLVDMRIKETVFILFHCDAALWTTLHTSPTATTIRFILDINHFLKNAIKRLIVGLMGLVMKIRSFFRTFLSYNLLIFLT